MTAAAEHASDQPLADEPASAPLVRNRLGSRRIPSWVRRALLLYLGSRLVVALGAVVALAVGPPMPAVDWFSRWDSFWYLQVAQHGYPSVVAPLSAARPFSALAFFPLWPLLIRGTAVLCGGNAILAAYLLNFLLGGVLAVLVRMVFATVATPRTADIGVALFVFFPGTAAFSAAYSEPLALCLAAGALLALLNRRWAVAGLLAALAGAARPQIAVAIIGAILLAVAFALRRREWRSVTALVLAPLGPALFMLYDWRHTGNPLAFHEAEAKLFNNRIDGEYSFYRDIGGQAVHHLWSPAGGLFISVLVSMVVLLVLLGFAIRRPPPVLLAVYALIVIAPPAFDSALMPKVRFIAGAFPLLLPLAGWLRDSRNKVALPAVLGVEIVLLAGFTAAHLAATAVFP